MVAGIEKYFQIARCFRDEDLRADRQPEFAQIDIEASFVGQEDIISLVQGLLGAMFKSGLDIDLPVEFPRMTYREAIDTYGSDKPDTRFEMRITDLAEVFEGTEFKIFRSILDGGGVVRAINAKGFAGITTGQMNRLNEIAVQAGLPVKNLAFIKLENGEYKSPLWKIFSEDEKAAVTSRMDLADGDIVFFAAGDRESVSTILGRVRSECAVMQELNKDSNKFNFLWVVDFPLLAKDEESGDWVAVHHPFTRPHADDMELLEKGDFANVRAEAYDVVLNGYELGGGSIRIHERDLQAKMFGLSSVHLEYVQEVTRHQRAIYGFIRSMIPDASTADDLLQETNIALLKAAPRFKTGSDFLPFATKVAHNKVIDHFRREKRHSGLIFDSALADKIAGKLLAASPGSPARIEALEACLKRLGETDRDLLVRRYRDSETVRAIAADTGRSESALQNHLAKIRDLLRQCIRQKMEVAP